MSLDKEAKKAYQREYMAKKRGLTGGSNMGLTVVEPNGCPRGVGAGEGTAGVLASLLTASVASASF